MNQRFTLDRKSFERYLAALSFVQQLKRQAAYQRVLNDENQPVFSLLQLQRAVNSGSVDVSAIMASVVKLAQSVVGANAAGVWLFHNADEFSCCARIGNIHDPDRLGADILANLAASNADSISCVFSPTLRKASHYPGSPNSVAIVGLRVNGKVVGAVAAFSSGFDAFAPRDLDNLHFLATLLERALQKAMAAGYREAIALEHAAVLNLVGKISPQVHDFQRQLLQAREEQVRQDPSCERHLYSKLQQSPVGAGDSYAPADAPADLSIADDTPSTTDISVPGVGVRAALGDVREFTGEDTPFVLKELVGSGRDCVGRLAAKCRSGALAVASGITLRMRGAAVRVGAIPHNLVQRGASVSVARMRSMADLTRNQFARMWQWKLRIRMPGLPNLHPASWLHLDSQWLHSTRSRSQSLWGSSAVKGVTLVNKGKERFSYLLRTTKVQARVMRRDLRQRKANVSAALEQERMRVRIAQRRQQTILASSAETTGDALQHAGESLAQVASSAGHSTITALAALKHGIASLKRTAVNPSAVRRSAGAIGVLAIMTAFVALQATMRHSLGHVSAAPSSAREAAVEIPSAAAAVKETSVQSKPGPSSHLEITDASAAETLHELTRYEIATLQRAADYGDDEAAFQLGMAYETGYYLRQNCSKAAHWVKVAAEAGNSAAAYNLGLRYRVGDGLQPDNSAAEHWLRTASSRQYSPAKLALAAVQ